MIHEKKIALRLSWSCLIALLAELHTLDLSQKNRQKEGVNTPRPLSEQSVIPFCALALSTSFSYSRTAHALVKIEFRPWARVMFPRCSKITFFHLLQVWFAFTVLCSAFFVQWNVTLLVKKHLVRHANICTRDGEFFAGANTGFYRQGFERRTAQGCSL